MMKTIFHIIALHIVLALGATLEAKPQPNIVLIMTDDQGWGQTGYYNHPVLKTPNIDAMAANGVRFDRFYAASAVCSPTRASVLTGRSPNRSGVPGHGNALRRQEKTLSQALKSAGYATGHFGKWHLNGLRGPGAPVLGNDPYNPGVYGFDIWLTVTNYFDLNPLMSREGKFEEFQGTSSEVIVEEALDFITTAAQSKKPFFAVIWDGSPHSPFRTLDKDSQAFEELDKNSQHHYGELVAFDRSVGMLRAGLRKLGVAEDTIVWYCSDNGGLPNIEPDTVGGLRGNKGSVWEGGLRVPGIIEWPAELDPKITDYPASTMDIFPTIADILNLPDSVMLDTVDGISLVPHLEGETDYRESPIPFRFQRTGAVVYNNYKLRFDDRERQKFTLYDLKTDPAESRDISESNPDMFNLLTAYFKQWDHSVDMSFAGKDYPEGRVTEDTPRHFWRDDERYEPYFSIWAKRPEYERHIETR